MPQWLHQGNRMLAKWLWWVVLLGVIGSLPIAYARVQTESSANKVEIIMDYKDILQVASTQADPEAFVKKQLVDLKAAGVNAMALFESTLEELTWSGDISMYDAQQAALLNGVLGQPNDNRAYVLFNRAENEAVIRPIVEDAFRDYGVSIDNWSAKGRQGVILGLSPSDAFLRPMQPNPLAMKAIKDAGFLVVPRISDRMQPYSSERMAKWMESFKSNGVTRLIFDGDAVPGFANRSTDGSLDDFAKQLKSNGIGISAIESLKAPQKGFNALAKMLDYNVVRLHSISEGEMTAGKPSVLSDRLVLATKDRNIRMIYLNAIAVRDSSKLQITQPFDTITKTLKGHDGAISRMSKFGFSVGEAHAFTIHHAPAEKVWRGLAILGAVSLIALTIGLFLPSLLLPATVLGFLGGAAVWLLHSSLLTQALALMAAIAAPTASVITLVRLLRSRRQNAMNFQQTAGRRLLVAIGLYIRTALLSLAAVPFVIALLNDITYSLVLQQFRGVSLLHLLPIALAVLYVLLYGSVETIPSQIRRYLQMSIKVFWVLAAVVLAGVGYYYLTRTGNEGSASGLELKIRPFLENTFHVRPRFKEFAFGHPLMLLGLFLALRYPKWPLLLIAVATMGQLSIVDTFAHIHTPAILSATRDLLGLGIGLVLGLVAIVVWQLLERIWVMYRRNVRTFD